MLVAFFKTSFSSGERDQRMATLVHQRTLWGKQLRGIEIGDLQRPAHRATDHRQAFAVPEPARQRGCVRPRPLEGPPDLERWPFRAMGANGNDRQPGYDQSTCFTAMVEYLWR
jgi:hypothetical protein